MNAEQLQVIKERVEKATPGPWEVEESAEGNIEIFNPSEDYLICQTETEEFSCLNDWDTQFICHSITDIPALIAEVERLQKENQKYSKAFHESTFHDFQLKKENEQLRQTLEFDKKQDELLAIFYSIGTDVVTVPRETFDRLELAEVKARMESEELAKIVLDDTYNEFVAKQEIKRLREALEFYANYEHWISSNVTPFSKEEYCSDVELDGGKLAKQALIGGTND